MSAAQGMPRNQTIQVPEWEHEAGKGSNANMGSSTATSAVTARPYLGNRFDTAMPPHRKYLGLRRRTFLLVLLAFILALLALIIGLAVGLTKRSSSYVATCDVVTSAQLSFAQRSRFTTPVKQPDVHRRPDVLRNRSWSLRCDVWRER